MLNSIRNVKFIELRKLTMFITAVCVLSLIKLRWPKNKSLFVVTSLRKKHDQMDQAEFNFQRCSFLPELHILKIFLLPMHPLILRSSFLLKIPRCMWVLSNSKWRL